MAELRNGFGRAFGSYNKLWRPALVVYMRDGQKIGAQAVFPFEGAAAVQRMVRQHFRSEGMKRLFHGIERLACASENSILEERCELVLERTFVPLAPGAIPGTQGHNGHAVLGEGAGLVGAEHRAAPSVSIAATRRVRTRAREIRQAPITMKTVRTSGNSSGSIDMPSAMPLSKASSHPPRQRP